MEEIFVVGAARRAAGQVPPCSDKPVADRQEVFVGFVTF
jgi:hypothetical protein